MVIICCTILPTIDLLPPTVLLLNMYCFCADILNWVPAVIFPCVPVYFFHLILIIYMYNLIFFFNCPSLYSWKNCICYYSFGSFTFLGFENNYLYMLTHFNKSHLGWNSFIQLNTSYPRLYYFMQKLSKWLQRHNANWLQRHNANFQSFQLEFVTRWLYRCCL